MSLPDLVVRSRRVVLPHGTQPAAVHVSGGVVTGITGHGDVPAGAEVVDAGDAAVLPGLVDTHVHVNEPGRTEWEGFETATRAAAAGGVTTIVDMPLNAIPPTTSAAALDVKRRAADGRCWVDVGFWGGIVPGNAVDLDPLAEAGAFGYKAFLTDSGVPEFGCVTLEELGHGMALAARHDLPVLVHAEAPGPLAEAAATAHGDPRRYETWLSARPDAAEVEAVTAVIDAARRLGARAHVLHLSSAEALAPLRSARAAGVAVTAETCPHYLTLAAEDAPEAATAWKCAPPVRGAGNREQLWAALAAGDIDLVVSDHSPAPPDTKDPADGDLLAAWGGIASLQLGLPLVWSAARDRGHDLGDLARWMSAAPASLAGLNRKGKIAGGCDADLVVFDPDATWTVDPPALEHRHPITPYAGRRLHGAVRATYLRGARVFGGGTVTGGPLGRLLRRAAG